MNPHITIAPRSVRTSRWAGSNLNPHDALCAITMRMEFSADGFLFLQSLAKESST